MTSSWVVRSALLLMPALLFTSASLQNAQDVSPVEQDFKHEDPVFADHWNKRATWNKLHGTWGKRFDEPQSYLPLLLQELTSRLAAEDIETSPFLTTNTSPYLTTDTSPYGPYPMDNPPSKRDWRQMAGSWGKRANRFSLRSPNWSTFRGSWGKRNGNWNKMSGTWGKRSNENDEETS